jgi:AraC-like DNA-binding protein
MVKEISKRLGYESDSGLALAIKQSLSKTFQTPISYMELTLK